MNVLSVIIAAAAALDAIFKIPHAGEAEAALAAAADVWAAVNDAVSGKVSPDVAKARIEASMAATLASNAIADKARDDKFPEGS